MKRKVCPILVGRAYVAEAYTNSRQSYSRDRQHFVRLRNYDNYREKRDVLPWNCLVPWSVGWRRYGFASTQTRYQTVVKTYITDNRSW